MRLWMTRNTGLSKLIYAESGDWTSSLFEGTGVKTEINYFLVWRMVHFCKECTYLDSKEEQRELSRRCPLLVTTNQYCHEKNHSKLFLSSPYPSSLTTSTFTNAIWAKNISIYQVGYFNICNKFVYFFQKDNITLRFALLGSSDITGH